MQSQEFHRLNRTFEIVTNFRSLGRERKPLPVKLVKAAKWFAEWQFLPYYFSSPPKWRLFLRALSGNARTLPDFAAIGPFKSGTSALASYLLQHPSILRPLAKEIKAGSVPNLQIYYPKKKEKEKVKAATGHALSGFFYPLLNRLEIMYLLHQANPELKVVLILRDPVKRAYSHWKWEIFIAGRRARHMPFFETFPKFIDQALSIHPDNPMATFCMQPVLETGIYHQSVALWQKMFGRDRVLVTQAENFFADEKGFVQNIHEFLGLPREDLYISDKIVNENPMTFPPMDEESRDRLSAFYRPFNQKLFSLIETEFGWL